MTSERTTFYGVDFSGAARPGRKIWISRGTAEGTELQVEWSHPANECFEHSERGALLEELREWIGNRTNAVIAFDFPFGLPRSVHAKPDETSWEGFVESFTETFGNDEHDATEFRTDCAERAGDGERKYHRRETDWRRAGQCPYGNQIQYQTYFGLSRLLEPIISSESAVALPMQSSEDDSVRLIETYPAAVFGSLGLYRTGYKSYHPSSKQRRTANLDGLRKNGLALGDDEPALKEAVEGSDDALDSLACLLAAYRSVDKNVQLSERVELEGWIYACE